MNTENDRMNTESNRQVDEWITSTLNGAVPVDVERRLRSQLEDFRFRLGQADSAPTRRRMGLSRRAWQGMAMAASVAVIALGWFLHASTSFADVAAAVLKQPWIHVASSGPDGKKSDFWFSPAHDVSATRKDDWIEYLDHRLRVYQWYDAKDNILYRVPECTPRRPDGAMAVTALQVLLQGEKPAEKPLEQLGFLRDSGTDVRVIGQKLERVDEGGRKWLDYRLTLRTAERPEPLEMLFRVAPETKLVHIFRIEQRQDGKLLVGESRFEYPEKGPADAYDLGAPKTAKLVDRTPSNDVARILAAQKAGRQRMDNYRAIMSHGVDNKPFWGGHWVIMYRKGDKFRRDIAMWKSELGAKPTRASLIPDPPKDGDVIAWLNRERDKFDSTPTSIEHGAKQRYEIRSRNVKAPDGSEGREVEVKKYPGIGDPDDPLPELYSWMPEFPCYPVKGLPNAWMEPSLELNPKDGPAGTVLLRVRRNGRLPGPLVVPKQVQIPDSYRYWLDPARGYLAVRTDMLGGGEPGKEEVIFCTLVEEAARSPQGTWYATRVRDTSSATAPDGKKVHSVRYFYLDFNADLPDSLFEPPKPGRVP